MTENPDLVVCRQKAKELKRALGAALGDIKEDYWDSVRDFLTGRITREHFDLLAKNFLCKEKIKLHNEYVLTVVKCIMLPLEAPDSFFNKGVIQNHSLTKKRARSSREEKDFKNRQELKKIIRLMGKKEREKIKSLPQEPVPRFPSLNASLVPLPNLTGQGIFFSIHRLNLHQLRKFIAEVYNTPYVQNLNCFPTLIT